jgi:outer membrane cobalamin receptor
VRWAWWLAIALGCAAPVRAQETGEVGGTVVDSTTAKALPFANVVLVDTRLGANTQMDGTFRVRNVPPGTYQMRASYLGYEAALRSVTVVAGQTTTVKVALHKKSAAGTTKKIVVLDTRPLVDVSEISTVRTQQQSDIRALPVDAVADVVQRQVGVSGEGDQLHIRGGRSDETLFRIESVAMKNVVTGAAVGGTLSAKAVQEIQVVTGGYQAERGQAISGVVDVELKEAGADRRSVVSYESGSFDTERLFLQTEGREPVTSYLLPAIGLKVPGTVGLLIGADMLSSDTYLPSAREASNFLQGQRRTLRSGYNVGVLGLDINYDDFLRLRQKNGLNFYAKVNWRATSRHKINLTFTKFAGEDHGFERFRVGDDVQSASSENTAYRWDFHDQMDQYPTFTEDTNAQIATWKYAISNTSYGMLTLSHFFNDVRQAVQGKRWDEYDIWREPGRDQFFVNDANGDFPYFQDLFVDRWTASGNYTRRWHNHHEFKAGLEASYYTLQMIDIRNPREGPAGLGSVRDLYRVNPNDGAFYAQNQFKYEGFVGHVGLRGDYLFLGEQADDAVNERRNGMTEEVALSYLDHTHSLFGNRFKLFWSPRLGINHPITDHDEMHFNFGHFIQWPRLTYYYAKIGSQSSEAFPLVGNLDLDPQRSVQYEFGVKHQIGDADVFDATFFNKDVYDYPIATRPIEATAKRLVYVNDDFSRTRGIELVYRHAQRKHVGGGASYEFQIATGKPADPNRIKQVDPDALESGDAEPDLTEQFMPWNRPHRLQLDISYRTAKGDHPKVFGVPLPDRFAANLYYTLRSGRPYTPTTTRSEPTGKDNSVNAPMEHVLDGKLEKAWSVRGATSLTLTFEARNMLNTQILRVVDSNTGKKPEVGKGIYTNLSPDTSVQKLEDRLSNPAFYAEPRNLRLALEVSF